MKTLILRNINIIWLPFFFALLLLFSCEDNTFPGYKKSDKGFYFKLLAIGEDSITPGVGDFITVDISYHTLNNDSVFFNAKRKIQVTNPDYEGSIDDCFRMLSVGDSVSFLLRAKPFFEKTLLTELPHFLDTTSYIKVNILAIEIQTKKDYEKQKKEFLAWIKDFELYEKVFLQHYLEEKKIPEKPNNSGLYKLELKKGTGQTPANGDTVDIVYTGRFLNGVCFDKGIGEAQSFQYIIGTEWQVIKGMEESVKGMKEGEKSLFIMPSELAWGSKGSGADIVPPYTSVIFEVELKRIAKGDTTKRNII